MVALIHSLFSAEVVVPGEAGSPAAAIRDAQSVGAYGAALSGLGRE